MINTAKRNDVLLHSNNAHFKAAVDKGLSARRKFLPSRYLYDEIGDQLFQEIMNLPEYYPTRCETDIFNRNKDKIFKWMQPVESRFRIIELGAGDAKKTCILLDHFLSNGAQFVYQPIDISEHAISCLGEDLKDAFPDLCVESIVMEYFEALGTINKNSKEKKLILFLGSSIGNFNRSECVGFLSKLAKEMNECDHLMVGFDLKKDPLVITQAYNDSQGVTREFNFNLLTRINRELGADFDPEKFEHCPTYEPQSGEMKSYLVSKEKQKVNIPAINKTFEFEAWETIFTEVSNKYSIEEIKQIAAEAGLAVKEILLDKNAYYSDVVLVKENCDE